MAYAAGSLLINNGDSFLLGCTLIDGISMATAISSGDIPIAIVIGWFTIYSGINATLNYTARLCLNDNRKNILAQKNQYPLEFSEEVIIDDAKGLEGLLNETAKRETKEWGTFLRAHPHKDRAIIDYILPPHEADDQGLILIKEASRLRIDTKKAVNMGYNGFHHYHTLGGAANYCVSRWDRVKPLGWINLLSFMIGGEPEIIGFNHQYPSIYLPSDDSKRRLVLADPQEVKDYLSR